MSTITTDDDFETVEHVHLPNDDALDDEWTMTGNSIQGKTDVQDRQQYLIPSIAQGDDDQIGVPENVVEVKLSPSMSPSATNDSTRNTNLKVIEFIQNEGEVNDSESFGMASPASVTLTNLHQWVYLKKKDGSLTNTPTGMKHSKKNEDLNKAQKLSIYDVRNSDRRSCSAGSSSSNKWSIAEEQQRYRESGQTWGTSVASSVAYSVATTNHAVAASVSCKKKDDNKKNVNVMKANSTISGFDVVSLNDTSSQRPCHNCTQLNQYENLFCGACNTALQPNLCPNADALLAKQLQDKEYKYRYSFSLIHLKETKPKSVFVKQPLIVQSREFTEGIHNFMNDFKNLETDSSFLKTDKVGFDVLPEVSMVILASRFIETIIANHRSAKNADVLIRYCVTPKTEVLFQDKVKDNAFPPNSVFSLHFPLALQHQSAPIDTTVLGVIPNDTTTIDPTEPKPAPPANYTSSTPLSNSFGWIAAIVKGDDTSDVWNVSTDTCYTIVPNPNQTLPLLCFDASLWKTPVTEYLFQGIIRLCNDFFDTIKEQVDEDLSRQYLQNKENNARNQETVLDPDVAMTGGISPNPPKNNTEPNSMDNDANTIHQRDDNDAVIADVKDAVTSDFAKDAISNIANDSDTACNEANTIHQRDDNDAVIADVKDTVTSDFAKHASSNIANDSDTA
jgi:hypothetical protein